MQNCPTNPLDLNTVLLAAIGALQTISIAYMQNVRKHLRNGARYHNDKDGEKPITGE